MSTPILATKLYIPAPRPKVVLRSRLIEQLNAGLRHKLTLISAPAGFGKTTLLSEWVSDGEKSIAWLSLDEGDNDPTRFLIYLVAALQTIAPNIGAGVLGLLQSPQPPLIETMLTSLLNEITSISNNFILILDDYHLIDAKAIDNALIFLLDHLPPQMHLVIATREDPQLPLARLRVRGQLTELRATDLRFTASEAAEFLNQGMGLSLSEEDINALERRTEGWIAGLQLAAISMQGHKDVTSFIQSFTGSHHFVLDYLLEEVLQQQSESIQTFLLRTSILDRLCASLCDAVLRDPSTSGQETLEYIEHANLFLVPQDNERHWYRYHHLFADLLRQRLTQSSASPKADEAQFVSELHIRASIWYEENGWELEAFHHAAAANDIERAERLMEGNGMPLLFRGIVTPILNWLNSLPTTVLDARPSLWVWSALASTYVGLPTGIEEKLRSAEAALQGLVSDDRSRDLIGRIASMRAMLAVPYNQLETMISQSHRALEYLHPDNLHVRMSAMWTLGYAYQTQGDRVAASQAYSDAISMSEASGNIMNGIAATTCLGQIQESDNQLYLAAQSYRRVLELVADISPSYACEAYLGLARLCYQWNDLDTAEQHGRQSIQLAQQLENIDTPAFARILLARVQFALGNVDNAIARLAEADEFVGQHNFVHLIPEIAAARVLILLHQDNLTAVTHLVEKYEILISQARLHLAQRKPSEALAILEPLRQQAEAKAWADEQLKVMILQVVALDAHGDRDKAMQVLGDALALAEPNGFIRIFVDEGSQMAQLLSKAATYGMMPDYVKTLLVAFDAENPTSEDKSYLPPSQALIEPLSERELEVLQLVAQGLSNREISERLFLALDTIKGHNRRIYGKLQVQRRTEAVARARELGLL